MKIKILLSVILLFLFSACQDSKRKTYHDTVQQRVYLDKAGIDTTVSPGDNFYQYANGNWEKNTEIPKTESSWGYRESLRSDISKQIKKILELAAAGKNTKGSAAQKIGDFYASGMDTMTLEKLGIDPVRSTLAKIDNIKNADEIISLAAGLYTAGESSLFKIKVEPDDKSSDKNLITLYQAGLSFPAKYYTAQDEHTKATRDAYHKYIVRLFSLAGDSVNASIYADNILKLEKLIAASHISIKEADDPQKTYNKFSVADFQNQTPDINWADVLNQFGTKADTILVRDPSYYKALSALIKSQPFAVWKQKLKFDVLDKSCTFLNKEFLDASNKFNEDMYGNTTPPDRWQDIVDITNYELGDLVGQLYVKQYFTADAKNRMLVLVNNLQKVYADMIAKADWMEAGTKRIAIAKLKAMMIKIGYTEKWKNYEGVNIDKKTYYDNIRSITKNDFKQKVEKSGKPVDRTEWVLTPQSVGGYNNSSFNEIVFPAGSLQYPFFDPLADDAVNYGAIGMTIGHEITHGFDDYGKQFDAAGMLTDWWSKSDAQKYKDKADKVSAYYDKIFVLKGQHVNGAQTLTENIADLGGLNIAYQAFKQTAQGKSNQLIDGFTPDQRFFIAFAQGWRIKATDGYMINRLKSDTHSPNMARVNGCVYNMEAFYKAFNIPDTAKMYVAPNDRVGIW